MTADFNGFRHSIRLLALFGAVALACPNCTSKRGAEVLRSDGARSAAGTSWNIIGAWHVIELAVRTPGGDWEIRPRPQGGLYVFSERHYSYVYIPGGRIRPRFADPNRPTDLEKAAAYDTFIAGAGTYSFDGVTLDLKADLRKNPNEMTGKSWRLKVAAVTSDTLRFVFENPPFLPGREWRTTLVRAR